MEYGIGFWSYIHTHCRMEISAAGLQIDLCIDLIKVQNSAIVALPGAFTTWWISNHWGYKHPVCYPRWNIMLNQSNIILYSRLKISLYILGSIKTHRIYARDFIYPARITMKLYDMIQVYSIGSTVIMHMHYIWPVLHMTSCLVAINKNRDMCFWYEKWQKNIFQWGNPGERLSECVEGVEIYKINLKKNYVSQKFHAKNHPEANP